MGQFRYEFNEDGYLVTWSKELCPKCGHNIWTPYIFIVNFGCYMRAKQDLLDGCVGICVGTDHFRRMFTPIVDKVAAGGCKDCEVDFCRMCRNDFVYDAITKTIEIGHRQNLDGTSSRGSAIALDDRTKNMNSPGLMAVKL